jgi:hypothetical protein
VGVEIKYFDCNIVFIFTNYYYQDYAYEQGGNGSTIEVLNGTFNVASFNVSSSLFTLKSANVIAPPTLIPIYNGGNNSWLFFELSNVTISGVIIYHTYNYSGWSGGLINSAPLFLISNQSHIKFGNVFFTTANPTLLLSNPVFVGTNANSVIDIENSTFLNINLKGVSLVYDCLSSTFNVVNVSFKYKLIICVTN